MKKITFVFLLFAVSAFYCDAQESLINVIRERYNEIQAQIADEYMKPLLLTFDINRPGIGMQKSTIKFYWNNMSSESYGEDAQGNTAYLTARELSMAVIEYNVAGSAFYHIEYVYDKSGSLVFYFQRSLEGEVGEKRLYFNNGKLIKDLSRTYERTDENGNGKMTGETSSVTNFSDESKKLAETLLNNASEYKKHFESLFKIESLH